MTGHRHVVAASTGDYEGILITLTAATKTFNLAACQNSILIIQMKHFGKNMMNI